MSNTDEIDHTKPKTFHENDIAPLEKSTGDVNSKTSNVDTSSIEHNVDKVSDGAVNNSKPKGWVQFEDEDNKLSQGVNIPQMENVDLSEKVMKLFIIFFLSQMS